ncbi:tRNA pseudouridine(38-40) synthase TruA, partial [Fulvivirga sp. RKSG066]|uniref:DUF2344 domain-containing protein n=1 Tax=Fulvivirga aurantia TaxID=2529383 RepID=UPI0012BC3C90|nr:tRNA pseudouridine(38-40) synthase TruA [Fulvivirga aurantia]
MKHPNDHYYLITFQYLGFRYHGWQRQPHVKTVQGMVEKTVNYVLKDKPFKVLGAGRTDAMVSVNNSAFQLILREEVSIDKFFKALNENLPPDIKALEISKLSDSDSFNIIQDVAEKEYLYYFTYGEKMHPFCAPFMTYVREELDIEKMSEAATHFEGKHDFQRFCESSDSQDDFVRSITTCVLAENTELKANFFPKKSYVLRVVGKGFLRYQIRYMM